jgi:hypothetical protein
MGFDGPISRSAGDHRLKTQREHEIGSRSFPTLSGFVIVGCLGRHWSHVGIGSALPDR